ncbi:unnamed protein product [Mytilus edulis]|uniref:MULE transposase domain-containing protein n=1 Tax=Mytilus edulis TaxID=6550 RepID=A0A8S3V8W0_MYTED|nr:unnamed protein product [Mytilus edulis]
MVIPKKDTEYLRTPATVMTEMSDLLQKETPLNVYNKLTLKHDELSGPTSRRQVHDKKYRDKKNQRKNDCGQYMSRGNIADHINEIDKKLSEQDSIVKSIIRDHGKAPCLIMYTEQQLEDIKTLCCSGQSIVGIDKTFNLCDMHVTALCFKQTAVNMESTSEHPIFLGPVFIHDNSDFECFTNFFNHLKVKLRGIDTSKLVFGTDEEVGLINAVKEAFPQSRTILCTRHLRQNAKQKLIDDAVNKKDRDVILDSIFGNSGLLTADDVICFEAKSDEISKKTMESTNTFNRYFENRLKNNIQQLWETDLPEGHFDKPWTNNNSESLNHVLKRSIAWESKPLLDLVQIIEDAIKTQYKDLLRSIVSTGQYRLASTHQHFTISKTIWINKTSEERQRLFNRFRRFVPKDNKVSISSDGKMTVIKPRSLGKKIGQRKRKINERTTSFKRTKTSSEP